MKKTGFFAAAVLGWVMLSSISLGYSGGDGSAANPYQIAVKADLLSLITDYTNYNKCFVLTADIDLQGTTFDMALISPGWFPPTSLPAFSGTFDGNGHVIFNLTINKTTSYGDVYLGLFGISYGQIKNLGLKDVEINIMPRPFTCRRACGMQQWDYYSLLYQRHHSIFQYFS